MKFSEIFRKNVTHDDIKSDWKTKHCILFRYFLKYILRLKTWIFLSETSILVFFQITNISFSLSKNKLRKNCQENHSVKGMMLDMFFGICPSTSCTPKFWHAYYVRRFYSNCRTLGGNYDWVLKDWLMSLRFRCGGK